LHHLIQVLQRYYPLDKMAVRLHSGPSPPPRHNGLTTPPTRDGQRRVRRYNPSETRSSAGVFVDDNEEIKDVVYVSSEPDDVTEHNSTTRQELTPVSKDDGRAVQGTIIDLTDDGNNDSVKTSGLASAVESTDDDTVDDVTDTCEEPVEPEQSETSFHGNKNTEDTADHSTSNGRIVNTSRFHHDSTDPATILGTAQYNFSLEHGSANHSGNHDRIIDYMDWGSQRTSNACFQCSGQFDPEEENEVSHLLSFYENRNSETEPDYAEEFEDMHNLSSVIKRL
jgi:hypothetical protein